MSAMAMAAAPATYRARGWAAIWLATSVPMSSWVVARVTIRPVDTDISSAGIWETRPSPMVSRL